MLVNYTTWKRLNENADEIDSSGATPRVWRDGTKYWLLNDNKHRVDGPAVEHTNGTKEWYLNDKRHRVDSPAVERASGNNEWYLNDRRHRVDGPAVEDANGDKKWYLDGKLHRVDGPAEEWADGTKVWYLNNKLHRVDGPAREWVNGTKEWWLNNKIHRVDGPAIEEADGSKEWYISNTKLTYDEFIKSLNDILDGNFVQYGEIIVTKADVIKGIIPDAAEIRTISGIRDSDGDIRSELEGALDGSEDSVGLVKMAKAIAAVFGGDISIVKWLDTKLQNKFNASEIDMIVNYFHKNTFELEGLDSLFGHNDNADW